MVTLKDKYGIEDIKQVCDNSTSKIYGFIMYTQRHSYIIKVLRDDDFWNELDEISGANWPIFSVKPRKEVQYSRVCNNGLGNLSSTRDTPLCQMMTVTGSEPNYNREFLKLFSLDELIDLPCFVTFIWRNEHEIEQVIWKLSNKNEEEAFDSIREVVEIISRTESEILPEYKKNDEVFRNVKGAIEATIYRRKTIRIIDAIKTLKEYFPF